MCVVLCVCVCVLVCVCVCVGVCVFQVELLCEESLPSNYPPTHLPTVPHSLCQATALSCSLVSRHGSDVGAECFQCTVVSAWLWDPVWDLVTLRDLKQIQMKDCCTRSGQQQNRHQNLDAGICMCACDSGCWCCKCLPGSWALCHQSYRCHSQGHTPRRSNMCPVLLTLSGEFLTFMGGLLGSAFPVLQTLHRVFCSRFVKSSVRLRSVS